MSHDGASAVHRTPIYLERSQYEILRARARKEGRSLAAVIREILDEHLGGRSSGARRDPLHRVIGIGEGDGSAVAENCEDFLYGFDRHFTQHGFRLLP